MRQKARVQRAIVSIVEWQSLHIQEYRYNVIVWVARCFELLGIRRPLRFEPPTPAGDYDHALHVDHPEASSLLKQYLDAIPSEPKLGGAPAHQRRLLRGWAKKSRLKPIYYPNIIEDPRFEAIWLYHSHSNSDSS
ncbi:MAG: hypothetical protein ABSA01_03460 [Anaerolineales bacterium]